MGKKARGKKQRQETASQEQKIERGQPFFINIIRWSVYLSLFTPLIVKSQCFFPFVGPKSLYFMALAEVAFFSYLALIIKHPRFKPKINLLFLVMVIWVAVLVLSSLLGVDPSRSFWSKFERMTGVLMWLHLLAFFVVISSVFKKDDWYKILFVSLIAAVMISFFAIVTLFSPQGSATMASRGGATIGNSSFLATYLLFNLFFGLYLLFKTKEMEQVFVGLALLIVAFAFFTSGGRAAIISALIGFFLIFLCWLSFREKKGLRIIGRVLLFISVLSGITIMVFIFTPDNFFNRVFAKYASYSRYGNSKMALSGLKDRPLLGWGPENFEIVFAKYFNPSYFLREFGGEVWFDRAHNIIFDTLSSSGILGLISYIAIFVVVFWVLWKGHLKQKADENGELEKKDHSASRIDFKTSAIFSALLVAYFLQNMTVFDMVSSYLMFILTLSFVSAFAFSGKTSISEGKNVKENYSPGVFAYVLITVLFLFSFWNFVFNPYKSDFYTILAATAKGHNERMAYMQKALESSVVGKYQIRGFFGEGIFEISKKIVSRGTTKGEAQEELAYISAELEKSVKESPLDFRSWLVLGQVYNTYGGFDKTKVEEASRVLRQAMKLSPTNQQVYWALAQTCINQQKYDEALELAIKALELEPKVERSSLIAIEVALIAGKKDTAMEIAKNALSIDPSWEKDIEAILMK